jgi:hypothetical protein
MKALLMAQNAIERKDHKEAQLFSATFAIP